MSCKWPVQLVLKYGNLNFGQGEEWDPASQKLVQIPTVWYTILKD